ncbi:hypothetical protein FRB99_000746 [Tulasnella sp. 403]|nr:hypothetical protein FRB99_000746 [Tulasnella sp. 403]
MEYLFIINQAEQIDENHVVAQLLRRYYTSLTVSARPRIVVTQTTTSAQISYEHLLAMEDVVHASVWGMPDDARSQTTPGFTKPTEVVILYEQETYNDAEWSLLTDLEKLEGPSQRLVKEIAGARRVRQELGLAALDLFWRRRIDSWSVLPQGDNLDAALLDKIKSQVKGGALKPLVIDPATEGFNVSSKFVRLYDIVLQFEIDKANFRGLIFVATKLLAGALMDTLRALLSVSAWLKPHILLDDTASTDKIVKDFREGRVNLLICNSAAEDSLELPPASCAIYWDLPSNYVSYSCLKAKLDPEFGHAILLCEKGNDQHRRFVLGLSTPRPTWARWIKNMDNSSRNVPPIDMLEENAINGPDEGDIDNTDEDPILDPVTDPSLFRPPPPIHRTAPPLEAEDVESPAAGQNSTVAVKSAGARKRSERSGCTFYYRRRAGFWLRSLDAPHGRLYPTVVTLESQVPAVGDEVVPLRRSLCILARLPLPSFPSFRVYGTKGSQTVQLRRCAEVRVSDEELQAIYRFTTLLYQTVTARRCESTIERCGCFVVPLLPSWPDVLKYALEQDSWPFPPVTGHIAWDEIRRLEERPMTPVQGPNCSEELRDILLLDRPSTKLYEILEVCSGLGPLSKVGGTGVEADYANLLEYYQAVRPEPIVLQSGDQNILLVKPMPSAFNQLKPDIKDLDTGPDDPRKYPRYVIPELCMKHPIAARQVPEQYSLMNLVTMIVPISVLRTALVLPSILSRIDSYLVLKEFNALTLENRLQDADLLEAMTPLAAMMDVNYERLELLGDAFLKHLASIYLIVTHPDGTEKELHTLRTVIIRNATLLEIANRNSIPEFIQSKPPTMRSWLPPGFWVPGGRKVSVPPVETKGRVESANEDDMSDLDGEELVEEEDGEGVVEADSNVILTEPQEKTQLVADVCEALMGVSFLRSGEDGALQLCKKIGLPIPLVDRWDDFARKTVIPPLPPNLLPSARQKLAVEKIIGCAFAKPELLGQALASYHASKKAQEVLKDDPDFMGRVCNCQEAKEEREAKKKRAAENRKEEIRLRRERELQDEQDAVEELV